MPATFGTKSHNETVPEGLRAPYSLKLTVAPWAHSGGSKSISKCARSVPFGIMIQGHKEMVHLTN